MFSSGFSSAPARTTTFISPGFTLILFFLLGAYEQRQSSPLSFSASLSSRGASCIPSMLPASEFLVNARSRLLPSGDVSPPVLVVYLRGILTSPTVLLFPHPHRWSPDFATCFSSSAGPDDLPLLACQGIRSRPSSSSLFRSIYIRNPTSEPSSSSLSSLHRAF